MGLVTAAFKAEDLLKLRNGNLGIGHTRYSTTGISELQNCQPFVVDMLHGKIAVAHNGELINAACTAQKGGLWFIGITWDSHIEFQEKRGGCFYLI